MRAMKEPSPAADEKEIERKRLAAERRKKVMEQMKNAQKNFMKENKDLFSDTQQKRPRLNTEPMVDETTTTATAVEPNVPMIVQCLGPDRASPTVDEEEDGTTLSCILCQEEVSRGKSLLESWGTTRAVNSPALFIHRGMLFFYSSGNGELKFIPRGIGESKFSK